MSSLLLFNRVYRLEIQSVMLVFSTPFVNQRPSTFSPVHLPHPLPCTTPNKTQEGRGPQTPAAKSLYLSILRKAENQGLVALQIFGTYVSVHLKPLPLVLLREPKSKAVFLVHLDAYCTYMYNVQCTHSRCDLYLINQ